MSVSFASAADTKEQRPRVVELGRDVYGYISEFDPNCGFIVGDDSILVVDTRPTPKMARSFIEDIRQVSDKPIKTVFLTHYHAVRVMGASAFEGATVISSRGTHDWIVERGQADFESEVYRFPRLFQAVDEVPGLTMPQLSFDGCMSMWFGDREVRFQQFGRGHSQGDAICWLPADGIVFSGDLVENRCGVYAGDAYIREWMGILDTLKKLEPRVLVPGRGAAVFDATASAAAIDMTRDFLQTLLDTVAAAQAQGGDLRACYEAAQAAMRPRFGDWPVFQHVLPFDVSRAFDELAGIADPRVWTAQRDLELWAALKTS
ncbi:MBL fold metallo-hydrolase [Pseudoduganella namucuonensis]|uniref:Glyoxylase, beta-lactamase superfamily II n=1 Tax=Pseudoduganella namucuonensis TaxID=1035707 RepID=A0A1I7LE27_9BURK|nr:MBL fold metallo-hydrolase [Pseudoduganella namucuonensis]SFV07940.1 Glyoxylase, beta-lactamase superfamily II [Pseudoduganella namucuonensis]